jgi:predicted Fe-S protein YdhL (DUF1289 family)
MKFSPCRGGNNCTEGGAKCEGCGRTQEEVAETRKLVNAVATFAVQMGYENLDEFTQFVATKASGRARMLAAQNGAK